VKQQQGVLPFARTNHELDRLERDINAKEDELRRRRHHYEELRKELGRERARIVGELIPRRYAMRGDAQVLPIAVEIVIGGSS